MLYEKTDEGNHQWGSLPPNEPRGFTQNGLAFWAMLIGALILMVGMLSGEIDLIKIANKLLNVATVLVAGALYNLFFLGRRTDTDAQIFSDPRATAQYAGAVLIACGIAIAG